MTVPQTTDEGSTAEEDMETVSNEGESEFDEPTSESETDENASDDVVEKQNENSRDRSKKRATLLRKLTDWFISPTDFDDQNRAA